MSSFWLAVIVFVAAGFEALGLFTRIGFIGKERKPITSADAVGYGIVASAMAVFLVLAGLRLLGRA